MADGPSAAPLLAATGLEYHIGTRVLLDRQDLFLLPRERVALVGRNGCGKSSLLRILAGTESFFSGKIATSPALRVECLSQEALLPPDKTAAEIILSGAADITAKMARRDALPPSSRERLALEAELHDWGTLTPELNMKILMTGLDAPPESRIAGTLSGGESRRVDLCRALVGNPDLLLLDEPTNHLDTDSIEWLETYLKRFRGSLLFVTHDRLFLDRIATRVIELEEGILHSYTGNYSDFLKLRAERHEERAKSESRRLAYIRREIDWIRRGPKARGTKSKSRIRRFEQTVAAETRELQGDIDPVIPPAPRTGNIVLKAEALGMRLGDKDLFAQLDFDFEPGMRIGVVGRNGTGKTTLLRLLLGELQATAGSVRTGDRTRFVYADQKRADLDPDKTVLEEAGEGMEFVRVGEARVTIRSYLKRFLFEDEEINTRVERLSGGERNRLVLAKILKQGGNFIVLDEPTNDLDLSTLRVLEEELSRFEGCVLVVSHDRFFLNRICTGILALEGDGRIRYTPGDYDYYARMRDERRQQQETIPDTSPAPAPVRPPTTRRMRWADRRELDDMEKRIPDAEAEVEALEALFSSPDFYDKYGERIRELTEELDRKRGAVEALYGRWEELEALRRESEES